MDKWIKNNTIVKILAIAVGILLWGMVHIENDSPTPSTTMDTTIIENVKVQTYGLDESSYVLNALDTERVRIEVKGKRSALTSIFNEDYKVTLNLGGIKEGTFTVPLTHELPSGVELVSMSPSMVTVTIEKKTQATFPVTLLTTGELYDGYIMGDMTIEPNLIRVTLPETELKSVVKVTGTVELDGNKEAISEKKVKLVAIDSNGLELKDAVIEPEEVSVQIALIAPSKKVSLNMEYTGNPPEGLVVSKTQPNVSEVTIFGPKDIISQIDSYDVANIDLSKIDKEGKTTISVELILPEGVEKMEPNLIDIEIDVVASVGQVTLNDIPITVEGTSGDKLTTFANAEGNTISLAIKGAYTLLNTLQSSDIKVIANVENLNIGTHKVPLEIILPQFTTLVSELQIFTNIEITDVATTPTTGDINITVPNTEANGNGTNTDPVEDTTVNEEVPPETNTDLE